MKMLPVNREKFVEIIRDHEKISLQLLAIYVSTYLL